MRALLHVCRLLGIALLLPGIIVAGFHVDSAESHHFDNGHSGYLLDVFQSYEMNSRTTTAQSIPITPTTTDLDWQSALTTSRNNWNSALSSTVGFSVYSSGTGFINVDSGSDQSACGAGAHGCVKEWAPNTPSARIYMYTPAFGDQTHRVSDLMHEMGHVLYTANEHYPTYNCTSIMGHCPSYTTVSGHDIQDYKDAFGVEDAPNATYVQVLSGTQLRHFFEGGYLGGIGRTIHQERQYWVDRSTTGITGTYTTYKSVPRIINNTDDTTPNYVTYAEIPSQNGEWCLKIRGQAGGLASSQPTYWGPLSKGYCVARDASNVFSTSDRNGNAYFRVWNFSGATITSVQIKLANGTLLCSLGSIANGGNGSCGVSLAGPGYVNIFYNGSPSPRDTVGYDG